ncbi:MAG: hypothetical protein AABZ64_08435 [Nitrospinota bacterium]
MNELAARILRGDILKTLYYQGAFRAEAAVGSFLLWSALREAGHSEEGEPLSRAALEGFVDELAGRGLLRKTVPSALGRLLTDYELHLTRKGRGLLEGALPGSPDILIGEL